jgi:phosphate transport system permease protein
MNNETTPGPGKRTIDYVNASLKRRYAKERRFKLIGLSAVLLGLFFVSMLFITILANGLPAFQQTYVKLDIHFDEQVIDPEGGRDPETLMRADYAQLVKSALREAFPTVTGRREKRELYGIISGGAAIHLQQMVMEDPELIGTRKTLWLLADDEVDMLWKGRMTDIDREAAGGIGSVVSEGDNIRVLSTSNDFTEVLAGIKQRLSRMADKAQDQLQRAERRLARAVGAVEEQRETLEQARSAGDAERAASAESRLAAALSDLEIRTAERDAAQAEYEDLRRRADSLGGEERLSDELPSYLVAINGGIVEVESVSNTQISGKPILPLDSLEEAAAGSWDIVTYETPEAERRMKDNTVTWVNALAGEGRVKKKFNTIFFTAGDSREPEQAGIGGAVAGSFFTLLVTLALAFPIGVAAALYLEEFAPKNRWTDLIEVNINNLAAVPSIVFGLLGLAVFINFFGLPRSAPLVGGLVLTLMTLPTIIIASRAALKSVPPSIREAALGVGASKMQAMFHHILPLAMPGMLTGTIIGMAQALGETAPLLMIGMVAFIVDIPSGPLDPAAVLPVQIFLWADSPERAFVEKTSAAIIVLLGFLIAMNALAVILRKRFERRW